MNAYIDVLKKYATFSGRARRREFWMFALVDSIIIVALVLLDAQLGAGPYLQAVYCLATALPTLAVIVRRLHDIDRSGASLTWCLAPIGGIVLAVVFLTRAGKPYINEYGPNPKTGYPDYTEDDAEFAKSHVNRW